MSIDNFINSVAKIVKIGVLFEGVSSQLISLKSKPTNFSENVVVSIKNEVLSGVMSGVDWGLFQKNFLFLILF